MVWANPNHHWSHRGNIAVCHDHAPGGQVVFPLPVTAWIKLGAVVAVCAIMWYLGYSFEASRFARYKADQIAQVQKIEREQQAATDQIRKQKDAQIEAINNQLANAISELRKRPSRPTETNPRSCGTGATLYADDAEFLVREAARADKIRTGLEACYKQYDAIKQYTIRV